MHGKEYDSDFDEVLLRAQSAGVEGIALVGCDLDDSRRVVERAAVWSGFRSVVGVHPHAAASWSAEISRALKEDLMVHPSVVAVGEIGLDYHYDFATHRQQFDALMEQLSLANAAKLPVVVHCREAYEDILGIFRDFFPHATPMPGGIRGVMHCYFGTVAQAEEFIDLGFVLGIGGAATFKKAEELHEVVRQVPLNKMVLETDAPYMAPVPHRGKRNEPSYLPLVAERIAELKQIPKDQVVHATTATARRLFGNVDFRSSEPRFS